MACYLNESSGVEVNKDIILKNCISQLKELGNDLEIQNRELPNDDWNLPELNPEQLQYMQERMSSGKAITFDGFSDTWIKKTDNIHLLKDIWRKENI